LEEFMSTPVRRPEAVTFRGTPMTLLGNELKVGDPAPDFTVLAQDLSPITLASTGSGVRVFSVVPSLDTGICDLQTRRFVEEVAKLPGTSLLTVSVDLPFAQKRWCGAAGHPEARTGSDHRDLSFGLAYGVVIEELRLLARSVFVVDADNRIAYAEYVPEVGQHPAYEAALAAARQAQAGN